MFEISETLPLMDTPTLDFSLLSSSNPHKLQKFRNALSSWGSFQLVNHGITCEHLDKVREMSKEFFNQPIEEKKIYSSKADTIQGYVNDNKIREGNFFYSIEKFRLQIYPEYKCKLEFWPQIPQHFRPTTLEEYSNNIKVVAKMLLKAMSSSLNIEDNGFLEQLWGNDEEDELHAWFNFYPPCPNATKAVGLKPHTDGAAITILLQDNKIKGLQVLKDGQWFRVPVIPGALIILVADQLEIASNGIFKSPIHKVVINDPQNERISLAMLLVPHKDKEIGPLKELITEERPQLFKKLKDYGQVYFKYMGCEERQINFVKINHNNLV